jgi:hypothetical protein
VPGRRTRLRFPSMYQLWSLGSEGARPRSSCYKRSNGPTSAPKRLDKSGGSPGAVLTEQVAERNDDLLAAGCVGGRPGAGRDRPLGWNGATFISEQVGMDFPVTVLRSPDSLTQPSVAGGQRAG